MCGLGDFKARKGGTCCRGGAAKVSCEGDRAECGRRKSLMNGPGGRNLFPESRFFASEMRGWKTGSHGRREGASVEGWMGGWGAWTELREGIEWMVRPGGGSDQRGRAFGAAG